MNIRKMLGWLKKLKSVVDNHDAELLNAHARITELEKLIKERTNIAVDVGFKSGNHVIVIGRYRNNDYVQTYAINTPDFSTLIDHLRRMEQYGNVVRVDAPPMFQGAFERTNYI